MPTTGTVTDQPSDEITTSSAARLLGVSDRTIKRYADAGILPCRRLPGGYRKFRPDDVLALRAATERAGRR